jgi:predicted NodU family carbamoyl transferase
MRIFGIHWYGSRLQKHEKHLSHDSSVCVIEENGEVSFFAPLERFTRIKRDSAEGVNVFNYFPHLKPKHDDVISFVNNGVEYKPKTNEICVDHHIAHACSSWMFRKDEKNCKFMAYDGYGFDCHGKIQHSLIGSIDSKGIHAEKVNTISSSAPLMKPLGIWNVGKLMGLAGYMPDAKEISEIHFSNLNSRNLSKKEMEECAGFYRYVINQIWADLEKEISKEETISISGGTALALELNSRINNKCKNVIFGPPTDDSGLALGCAAYAYFIKFGNWPNPLVSPSLVTLQRFNPQFGPQKPKEIAKILHDKKVIGLIRGKSECGPRALGYRSLIAAPTQGMKEIVSCDLKNREIFRPLSPIVTDREFDRFFEGPKGEYMQYMTKCKKKNTIPSVCHTDDTSRPQVVYPKDEWLYELLIEYGKLSGHECLINTSLNKNKPICNTLKDAQEDFSKKIIYCSIGSKFY